MQSTPELEEKKGEPGSCSNQAPQGVINEHQTESTLHCQPENANKKQLDVKTSVEADAAEDFSDALCLYLRARKIGRLKEFRFARHEALLNAAKRVLDGWAEADISSIPKLGAKIRRAKEDFHSVEWLITTGGPIYDAAKFILEDLKAAMVDAQWEVRHE